MLSIIIIRIGSIKDGSHKTLEVELLKRLGPYAKIKVKELKPTRFKNAADSERVFKEEATQIRDFWDSDSFKIVLSEHGKITSSEAFAKSLSVWSDNGQRSLTFIIGSALGIDRDLMSEADHVLSLSPMTFPHETVSVLLLEQLYRAGTIINGKTYHY
ncbi:MAG: 23S rRNA (pseudouridine(1915)-N(3))-methyltransferase RlmH [Parcubacteria group bacterium]|nr:23S rRNA (pseudouridine(1915)-N(3))-methyltransferase RlmH [Parcubacteria group bacterium]